MKNVEVDNINKVLSTRYGKALDGRPFFRVVFSEDLFELRKGTFNEFYGSIYVRTYTGVKQVRKYNYVLDRYILEMLHFNEAPPEEVVRWDNYECLYVFEDSKGNYLPPKLFAAEFVIWNVLNLHSTYAERMAIWKEYFEKKDAEEEQYFKDYIENSSNFRQFQFRNREAVILGGTNAESNNSLDIPTRDT